jgi:hypothetical protein
VASWGLQGPVLVLQLELVLLVADAELWNGDKVLVGLCAAQLGVGCAPGGCQGVQASLLVLQLELVLLLAEARLRGGDNGEAGGPGTAITSRLATFLHITEWMAPPVAPMAFWLQL